MSVANAYAKALFEAAQAQGISGSAMDDLESQVDQFTELLAANPQLNMALTGPVITSQEKTAIVEALTQRSNAPQIFTRFLQLLADKNRFTALPQVREAFNSIRLEAEGGVAGKVVAADAMSAADVDALSKAFTKKLGKKVAFRVSTDPSLLAGMKVTVNGITYDGSLSSQLQQLRDRLVAGAS